MLVWPISYAEAGLPAALATLSPAQRLVYEQMAGTYLWNWTNRVFGLNPVVVRPCRDNCLWNARSTMWGFRQQGGLGVLSGTGWYPVLVGGDWYNVTCGTCGDRCSCGSWTPALKLPGPVASIQSVTIDGVVLAATAYRVDNAKLVVRLDGGRWPTCQDMTLPTTAVNTWAIAYTMGLDVPVAGQVAAGVLANELALAASGDASCRLPARLSTVTRQGVTVTVLDSFDGIDKGRTGIWMIDSWIASVIRAPRMSRVYSVDVPRPHNRTTTWP